MNTTTKKTAVFKPTLVLLSLLMFIAFTSFNKKQPTSFYQPGKVVFADQLESLGIFTLDYPTFLSLGGSWDRRLILQFRTSITNNGSTKYDVAAFLAKSQEDHGVNAKPILLTSGSSLGLDLPKGKSYYIGNNYIRLRTIKKYLNSLINDNPNTKISALRFTAVTWKAKTDDHVFFLIQALDENGNVIQTDNAGIFSDNEATNQVGGELSNPSPPADPSTN